MATDNGEDVVDRKYARFMAWLDSNGAELYPGIELFSVSSEQRGVKTSCAISAHSTIISIPLECLITDQMGREQTEIGKIIFSPRCDIQLSAPALLAVVIFILEHQRLGEASFFHPYLAILPTDWSNFPVFWSEERITTWLQGSPLQHDVRDRQETMEQDYEEILRVAGKDVFDFTLEEFLHVRTCVGSRNFGIQVDGQKRTSMVPFADMLNHLRPRQTSWTFDSRTRNFTITSLEPLSAQSEVMDSYGKKDNARFLLHYGFAVEGNREEDSKCPNELLMEIYCEENAEECKTKLALLGSNNQARYFKLSMHRDDRETSAAIAFARILVATEDELLVHVLQQQQRFVSLENEIRALQCIAQCCQAQLLEYAHTFEHNVQRLKQDKSLRMFSAERSALIVITGEQEICKFWVYLASTLAHAAAEQGEMGLKMCKQALMTEEDEEEEDDGPWSRSYWVRDCAKHVTWLLDAIADAKQRV